MKKIFILFAILQFSLLFNVKAQGNLQFNRVVVLENGSSYIVPTNKVFKVESINMTSGLSIAEIPYSSCTPHPSIYGNESICYYSGSIYLKIGTIEYSVGGGQRIIGGLACNCPPTSTIALSATTTPNLPIWLDSGKVINVVNGNGIQVTGIEFNIIQ
jgi:hypothetical protein